MNIPLAACLLFVSALCISVGIAIGYGCARGKFAVWFSVQCPGCKKTLYVDPVKQVALCKHQHEDTHANHRTTKTKTVWLAVSSQGSADTMEIHGVYDSKEAADTLAWSKGFGTVEEWPVESLDKKIDRENVCPD